MKDEINMNKPNVCIVSFPMPSREVINLSLHSLVTILRQICDNVYVLTANYLQKEQIKNVHIIDVRTTLHFVDSIQPILLSVVLYFLKVLFIQLKMCISILKIYKKIDILLFHVGDSFLLPMIFIGKVLNRKIIIRVIGRGSLSYRRHGGFVYYIFYLIFGCIENLNFLLADLILVETKSAIRFLGLEKYKGKVIDSGARYIDLNMFRCERNIENRDNIVGYIGRLHETKGILNLIEAIPLILEKHVNVKFVIGGKGPLYPKIKELLNEYDIDNYVKLLGPISHDKVPKYLNRLKLLVLPSYSEGLPTIVLEAMACGTPVLATPVGGIPDIISDGETGFILENNSPECIAENVIRVLNYPNLKGIVKKARKLVERNYSYDAAVRRYKETLTIASRGEKNELKDIT